MTLKTSDLRAAISKAVNEPTETAECDGGVKIKWQPACVFVPPSLVVKTPNEEDLDQISKVLKSEGVGCRYT